MRRARCALLVLVAVLPACGGKRLTVMGDPRFRDIDRITVLPGVDLRIDREHAVDLRRQLQERTAEALRKKGYETDVSTSPLPDITSADLDAPEKGWIEQEGTVVCRERGTAQVGQGGLLGIAVKTAMDEVAIDKALENALVGIPVRPPNYVPANYVREEDVIRAGAPAP
jgi:hypothetical protein